MDDNTSLGIAGVESEEADFWARLKDLKSEIWILH